MDSTRTPRTACASLSTARAMANSPSTTLAGSLLESPSFGEMKVDRIALPVSVLCVVMLGVLSLGTK